jgi:membrane peptidoglycan carboxypeptidase
MRPGHPLVRLLVLCVAAGLTVAGIALPFFGGAGLFARTAANSFTGLPSKLPTPPPPQRSRILAADGSVIATFFAQNRVAVPLTKISPVMQHAIVAVEDARFFQHGAIDFKGTLRAALTDLGHGGTVQGGSTLTQQYVKNVLLYAAGDRAATADSIGRKLREARYAIGLEQRLTKQQILDRYLNIVYFGEGAYGVQAAARRYFGINATHLDLAQSALLAGLVQSPTSYDPTRDHAAARARRDTVLQRMVDVQAVPAAAAQRAMSRPLGLHPTQTAFGCAPSPAPFFCDYVHQELLADPRLGRSPLQRERTLMTAGLTVHTTLDLHTQRAAQHAVDRVVPSTSRVATAVAAVRPGTGGVLALAVDRRYGNHRGATRVNLATGGQSGFQAGSTFKVFTLAAALAKHVPLSQTFNAPPQVHLTGFTGCGGVPLGSWAPKNAEVGEGGRFGLVRGTWESVNTYYAQLERKIGVCAPWRLARSMGITEISTGGPPAQVPAFTLGADDTSPLQMAGAYATLAARGRFCPPHAVVSITSSAGSTLERDAPACRRVMTRQTADVATSILRGVIDGPDPLRTGASAAIGRPAAGKTGTTDSFSAAWFSGFTPQLAASVWVGDPRGGISHPLVNVRVRGRFYAQVFGADLPAAVWRATMTGALAGVPVVPFRGAAATIAVDRTVPAPRPVRRHRHGPGHSPAPGPRPPKHGKHGG